MNAERDVLLRVEALRTSFFTPVGEVKRNDDFSVCLDEKSGRGSDFVVDDLR